MEPLNTPIYPDKNYVDNDDSKGPYDQQPQYSPAQISVNQQYYPTQNQASQSYYSQQDTQNVQYYPQQVQENRYYHSQNDSFERFEQGNDENPYKMSGCCIVFCVVISFLMPLIGWILLCVLTDRETAKVCGIVATVTFVVALIIRFIFMLRFA